MIEIDTQKGIPRQLFFSILILTIIFDLFLINSCNPVYTQSLKFSSKLSDGKQIKLNYEIIFEKESSSKKFQKAVGKIRYALSLVFSKVKSKELAQNGQRKARNSLIIILERHFHEKVMDVQVTRLTIQPS